MCESCLVSRRDVLTRIGGGIGAVGLAAVLSDAGLLAAAPGLADDRNQLTPKPPQFTPRAKHLIFLFMNGGPSHVDTFDPKPALHEYAGQGVPDFVKAKRLTRRDGKILPSPFKHRKYGQAGIEVTDLFPETAGMIDDICVIRSMHTDTSSHEPGLLFMNSGNMQPIRPSIGSWLTYALGSENQDLPGFIVLCPGKPVVGPQLWSNSFLPGIYQGTHIDNSSIDPKKIIPNVRNRYLSAGEQRRQLDLLQQMNREHAAERGDDDQLDSRIASLEMAYRMQGAAQEAFDLEQEPEHTRRRYGDGEFANACLLARRLVERGVRVVQLYYGDKQPWDDHQDITLHADHAKKSDRAIAALLADLKSRGLLDETLVLWGGEFGRTPQSEGAKGRDHHALGFTMWLAGGGIRGGLAYGATDDLGFVAVENRVHVHDLHATILHQMGLDHTRLTYRYSG
ncbi:MAG: DUF1501 domain-containing protein, partial [Pirellulales bacterium]